SATGSSASSSSNSSDSGFSLMRDGLRELDGANLKQSTRQLQRCPCSLSTGAAFGPRTAAPASVDQLVHLEDGQQHCKNDAHDEQAHDDDQQRTQQPHQGGQQPVELTFLADRGPLEHVLQLPARLAAGNEVNGH